jgi:hypothetical protein
MVIPTGEPFAHEGEIGVVGPPGIGGSQDGSGVTFLDEAGEDGFEVGGKVNLASGVEAADVAIDFVAVVLSDAGDIGFQFVLDEAEEVEAVGVGLNALEKLLEAGATGDVWAFDGEFEVATELIEDDEEALEGTFVTAIGGRDDREEVLKRLAADRADGDAVRLFEDLVNDLKSVFVALVEAFDKVLLGHGGTEAAGKLLPVRIITALNELFGGSKAGSQVLDGGGIEAESAQAQEEQLGDLGSKVKVLHAVDGEDEERLVVVLEIVADFLGQRLINGPDVIKDAFGFGA